VMPGPDHDVLLGGFAFYGPAALVLPLPDADRVTFTATLQNHSGDTALFRAEAVGASTVVELAPGEQRNLTLPLSDGGGELTLGVEGEADGLFFWGEPWLEPGERRPSTPLVLVTLDTTRRDAVPPWSKQEALTPVLSAFCREATVYSRAHAVSPWTLPAHASIFTGLYPSRHGAGVSSINLDPRFETLAERLRDSGYFTTGFAGGPLAGSRRGLAQGFCRYRDPANWQKRGDRLTDQALAGLEELGARPLFLFVNYFDPHSPYNAPPPFSGTAGGGPIDVGRLEQRDDPLPPEELARLTSAYLAEVSFMDSQLGRLFDALKARGLYDGALIVVLADHGEFLGEGGRFGHSSLLEPQLTEIPLMVKQPGQREPRLVEMPVSQVDLYATILAAAGLEVEPGDGLTLEGAVSLADVRNPLILEEHHHPVIHDLHKDPKRLADHLFATVGAGEKVTVWEGGLKREKRQGDGWQPAQSETGWREQMQSILDRLTPVITSPAAGPGGLDQEEVRQLQLLGYLADEAAAP